jgi:hypothetical protein
VSVDDGASEDVVNSSVDDAALAAAQQFGYEGYAEDAANWYSDAGAAWMEQAGGNAEYYADPATAHHPEASAAEYQWYQDDTGAWWTYTVDEHGVASYFPYTPAEQHVGVDADVVVGSG